MNRAEVIERLRACADDPMWANHAEVSKRTLGLAVAFLQSPYCALDGTCSCAKFADDPTACSKNAAGLAGAKQPNEPRYIQRDTPLSEQLWDVIQRREKLLSHAETHIACTAVRALRDQAMAETIKGRELGNDLWAWLRGFTKCEDCNGEGHTGDYWPGTDFEPPEPVRCDSCGGSGMWKLDAQ